MLTFGAVGFYCACLQSYRKFDRATYLQSNEAFTVSGVACSMLSVAIALSLITLLKQKVSKALSINYQAFSVAMMFAGLIPFSIYNSLRIERDFEQRKLPFNTVDGSIYYIWRSVPQIYIPVDYYRMNEMNRIKQEEAIRK
jgi:hypothetical protein